MTDHSSRGCSEDCRAGWLRQEINELRKAAHRSYRIEVAARQVMEEWQRSPVVSTDARRRLREALNNESGEENL
jgi:hypothetical protein